MLFSGRVVVVVAVAAVSELLIETFVGARIGVCWVVIVVVIGGDVVICVVAVAPGLNGSVIVVVVWVPEPLSFSFSVLARFTLCFVGDSFFLFPAFRSKVLESDNAVDFPFFAVSSARSCL